ncbi:nonstructural protein [robinz microvirus RP_107]|nr:nonstructural protein [robinz microvirus RP_107]
MVLHGYSIFDRKAMVYHAPFFAVSDGSASRSVADLASDTNTTVGRHPGDYVLYRVGGWDDAAGILLPIVPIVHVVDALSLVPARPADFFTGADDLTRAATNRNGKEVI